MKKNNKAVTISLIVAAITIAAFPMFFNLGDPNAEEAFDGTYAGAESNRG
ncbi:hypothetical protein [Corynebacterium rouxii]|nr:hypothetical protein [Corynebacterium rouxii]